jgi:hypothetical protein
MPLTNKYLKYSPEITLEIFKLIWDKLLENGWKPFNRMGQSQAWSEFKSRGSIGDDKNHTFFQRSDIGMFINCKETTVQEILGYNPFVKDSFVLPEKWVIKIPKFTDAPEEIITWRRDVVKNGSWVDAGYLNNTGFHVTEIKKDYIEITFAQFKQYVLKEPIKHGNGILDKVEKPSKQPKFKVGDTIKSNPGGWQYCEDSVDNIRSISTEKSGNNSITGKCTKVTYSERHNCYWYKIDDYGNMFTEDCITFAEEIIPEYVECIAKLSAFTLGKIYKTEKYTTGSYRVLCEDGGGQMIKGYEDKFKPSSKSAYDAQFKPKQPLKQAVHCKTQEEWDFVISKFNPLGLRSNQFDRYKSNSIIIFTEEQNKGYYGSYSNKNETSFKEILSFKEWCDLNGYEMETIYKERDCYVVTESVSGMNGKLNFCYKVYRNKSDGFYYDNSSSIGTKKVKVRPATIEEATEYSRIGKPYDITTLKSKEVKFEVGKYYRFNISKDKSSPTRTIRFTGINKDSNIICDLWTMGSDSKFNICGNNWSKENVNNPIELSIEEIQQYLPDNHPDKLPLKTKEMILDESHIGKLVSLTYGGRLYDEVLVTKENGRGIYLLNNINSNNNGHSDKSVYKYSLFFESIEIANIHCSNFKLLEKANIIESDLSSLSITELHEKGLVKRFFEEVVKVDFDSLPNGGLCSYNNFEGKSCKNLSCNDCYLHTDRRGDLKFLLEIKEQPVVKSNQEFKVGDYVKVIKFIAGDYLGKSYYKINEIFQIFKIDPQCSVGGVWLLKSNSKEICSLSCINATPEEINNHLISIGQISDLKLPNSTVGALYSLSSDYGLRSKSMTKPDHIEAMYMGRYITGIDPFEAIKPKEEPIKFKYFSED